MGNVQEYGSEMSVTVAAAKRLFPGGGMSRGKAIAEMGRHGEEQGGKVGSAARAKRTMTEVRKTVVRMTVMVKRKRVWQAVRVSLCGM